MFPKFGGKIFINSIPGTDTDSIELFKNEDIGLNVNTFNNRKYYY